MKAAKVANRADLTHNKADDTEIIRLALGVVKLLSSCQYGVVVFTLR